MGCWVSFKAIELLKTQFKIDAWANEGRERNETMQSCARIRISKKRGNESEESDQPDDVVR